VQTCTVEIDDRPNDRSIPNLCIPAYLTQSIMLGTSLSFSLVADVLAFQEPTFLSLLFQFFSASSSTVTTAAPSTQTDGYDSGLFFAASAILTYQSAKNGISL